MNVKYENNLDESVNKQNTEKEHVGEETIKEEHEKKEMEKKEMRDKENGSSGNGYEQIYQSSELSLFAEQPSQKAGFFKVLGLPSLIYALIYAVCTFRSNSGITMPVWVAATIVYTRIALKGLAGLAEEETSRQTSRLNVGNIVYIGIMLLLGFSTFLTDNVYIYVFNNIGFFFVLIAFLLHNFYDDSRWDFEKSLMEIVVSILGSIGCMLMPFSDGNAFFKEKKVRKNQKMHAILIGIVCAIPGVLILGYLLADADIVFRSMVMHLFSEIHISGNVNWFVLMALFGFFSSYCGMRFLVLHRRNIEQVQVDRKEFDPMIAVSFTFLIAAMYFVFCVIQIVYLFAGNMRLPEGMTYAQYARSGFFQLLFVCMVNLCMVLIVKKYFANDRILDWLLLLICVCTFIMIASSAFRMLLYIDTYQLTFLRVLVLVTLAVLVFLMAGTVIMIIKPQFPLFRYSMIVISVIYLAFSFSKPDYYIASYNLSDLSDTKYHAENVDWWYLGTLSLDAAPAVAAYYEKVPVQVQRKMEAYAAQAKELLEQGAPGYYLNGDDFSIETGWYGLYMYRVYEAEQNMELLNLNISRYQATKLFGRYFQ